MWGVARIVEAGIEIPEQEEKIRKGRNGAEVSGGPIADPLLRGSPKHLDDLKRTGRWWDIIAYLVIPAFFGLITWLASGVWLVKASTIGALGATGYGFLAGFGAGVLCFFSILFFFHQDRTRIGPNGPGQKVRFGLWFSGGGGEKQGEGRSR